MDGRISELLIYSIRLVEKYVTMAVCKMYLYLTIAEDLDGDL